MAAAHATAGPALRWEHFAHGGDIGVRGFGPGRDQAFEQAALALAAIAVDPGSVEPRRSVVVACEAPDDRLLLANWLNAVIFEMSARRMVFARFRVRIDDGALAGLAWGEELDRMRHALAAQPKGATMTAAAVGAMPGGVWCAQCVVDL